MAYTAPRTWVNGELIDASIMNTHIRDNLIYLKSQVASHIFLSGASGVPSTSNGCTPPAKIWFATNNVNFMVPSFSDTVKQYIEWTLPYLPDDYNGGTMTAKFIWLHGVASSSPVVHGIRARAFADGDYSDSAWGTAQEVSDTPHSSTSWTIRVSPATSAITIANSPSAGKLCQFQAYRDGAAVGDTYAYASYLFGVALNYTRA